MTGGRVAVLGPCGRNFAAGMSGGTAYVLDEDGDFDRHCNMDMVELSLVEDDVDREELRTMIENHLKNTGSRRAASLLADWEVSAGRFLKVIPTEYRKMIERGR